MLTCNAMYPCKKDYLYRPFCAREALGPQRRARPRVFDPLLQGCHDCLVHLGMEFFFLGDCLGLGGEGVDFGNVRTEGRGRSLVNCASLGDWERIF